MDRALGWAREAIVPIDWAVFMVGANSLGQRPYDRYGQLRPIAASPGSAGQALQIYGYGLDTTCTRSQTQQLSTGSMTSVTSTYYTVNNDIRGGNSGSAILRNNEIIGIVTHCSVGGCPNYASRIDLPDFVAARAQACPCPPAPGCMAVVHVNGQYSGCELGTPSAPFNTVGEGVSRVCAGGSMNITAGQYSEAMTISSPMWLVPIGGTVTIGP
jgi:hypothetical protein